MKCQKKVLSVLLTVVLCVQICVLPIGALNVDQDNIHLISSEFNAELKARTELTNWNDIVFYSYTSPELFYCSQMSSSGKIQFSYIRSTDNIIVESQPMDVQTLMNQYSMKSVATTNDMKALNTLILNNLDSFDNVKLLNGAVTIDPLGFDAVSEAIADAYGPNYSNKGIGTYNTSYGGKTYYVKCIESQTTAYDSPSKYQFFAGDAITSVVTWAIENGWSWVGAVEEIIKTVVSAIQQNGILKVMRDFTAQKTKVTINKNRIVKVDGNSGVHNNAGWTRKRYFF